MGGVIRWLARALLGRHKFATGGVVVPRDPQPGDRLFMHVDGKWTELDPPQDSQ